MNEFKVGEFEVSDKHCSSNGKPTISTHDSVSGTKEWKEYILKKGFINTTFEVILRLKS